MMHRFLHRVPSQLLAIAAGLVLVLGLSGCFKEKPIKMPYIYSGPDVFTANMGSDYAQQLYYNLQTFQFTDSNKGYAYDMAFDCDPTSYNVWINTSRIMFACHTGKYNLPDVTSLNDTLGHSWREELGSGIPSQNAIGTWGGPVSNREVYLINRGDSAGIAMGFKKMQFGDCSGLSYTVTYCNLDGSDMHTVSVPRINNRNKVYLSFTDAQVKDLEPDYTDWDINFTRYSIYFEAQNLPYRVTGVLTNPHKSVSYFVDSSSNFGKITIDSVKQSKFTPALDNIGYLWKKYGFASAEYTIDTNYNYIIRSDTRYYKLRFLQFYKDGNEGYPEFQVDELK